VQPVSLELTIDADEENRGDQNDQRGGDQSGLLAREQLMLQGERAAQEPAPIISPNRCFESRQVFEGAEIIVGWRRSGGRFLCELCGNAEDDEADRISSRASS
jgi:hypothetical protein